MLSGKIGVQYTWKIDRWREGWEECQRLVKEKEGIQRIAERQKRGEGDVRGNNFVWSDGGRLK